MPSRAALVAELTLPEREELLAELTEEEREALVDDWEFWARPEQLPPEQWDVWWITGGRGSGKTRAGAETAALLAEEYPDVDGGIVAPTLKADALRKCVEGESGLLRALGGVGGRLVRDYNRSEGVIYLRSGSSIFATGADNGAVRIQGENLGWCWGDEPGLWSRANWRLAWEESIQFAVRKKPAKIALTGTPKAGHPLIKMLDADPTVHKTRMRTIDNVDSLDADWARRIIAKYAGTRLGAQELEGILISEVEGALWLWVWIETNRWKTGWGEPVLLRVAVGVDPSGGANEIGIVGAGKVRSPCPCAGEDERGPHFAVLSDVSLVASPERWSRAAADLYHALGADRLAAEANFGGDMVVSTMRTADKAIPVKVLHASRGKAQRAEPVSAMYEQGRVHHVGVHAELETEYTTWVPGDDWSPNRLDASVWALTELAGLSEAPPVRHRARVIV